MTSRWFFFRNTTLFFSTGIGTILILLKFQITNSLCCLQGDAGYGCLLPWRLRLQVTSLLLFVIVIAILGDNTVWGLNFSGQCHVYSGVLEATNPFDLNFLTNKPLQNCNSPQRIYCTQCTVYIESACLILLNRTSKKCSSCYLFPLKGNATSEKGPYVYISYGALFYFALRIVCYMNTLTLLCTRNNFFSYTISYKICIFFQLGPQQSCPTHPHHRCGIWNKKTYCCRWQTSALVH